MTDVTTVKKLTLRDKKKAQPKAVIFLSDAERGVIKETVAKELSDPQFKVFVYTCQALGLNPLLNEVAVILYAGKMSIQVMRDGFLTIAHRSNRFAGLESGIFENGDVNPYGKTIKVKTAWAKAYNRDFQVPVYQEAEFVEFDNSARNALWKTKPNTMIKKVAESMALRKAFNINGVYAPEEMEHEIDASVRQIPQAAESLLDEITIKKINECKTLGKLLMVCQELKVKQPDAEKEITNLYTVRKGELERANS